MPVETATFEQVAHIYEKRIEELRTAHEELATQWRIRSTEQAEAFKHREGALDSQVDGLLGAVARLNKENAELKEELKHAREDVVTCQTKRSVELYQAETKLEKMEKDANFRRDALGAEITRLKALLEKKEKAKK